MELPEDDQGCTLENTKNLTFTGSLEPTELNYKGKTYNLEKIEQNQEKLKRIVKLAEMNRNHYKVLQRQNPKLSDEYRDVVRFCNSLLREILTEPLKVN